MILVPADVGAAVEQVWASAVGHSRRVWVEAIVVECLFGVADGSYV